MSVKKGVIPVAGFATRFLPACKSLPKCMLTIVDRPLIQYIIDEAVEAGIEEILLVVGRKQEVIKDYFSEDIELKEFLKERNKESFIPQIENLSHKAKISFIEEEGGAKGLGHAIYMAKEFVGNDPFAVLYGDVIMRGKKPCLKEIIEQYEQVNASVLGIERVDWKYVHKYGNISGENISKRLIKANFIVEKPNREDVKDNLAICDRHVLTPEVFDIIEKLEPGVGGEIQITDAYNKMKDTKTGIYGYCYEAKRFDSGDKIGFVKASVSEILTRPDLREDMIKYIHSLDIVNQKADKKKDRKNIKVKRKIKIKKKENKK